MFRLLDLVGDDRVLCRRARRCVRRWSPCGGAPPARAARRAARRAQTLGVTRRGIQSHRPRRSPALPRRRRGRLQPRVNSTPGGGHVNASSSGVREPRYQWTVQRRHCWRRLARRPQRRRGRLATSTDAVWRRRRRGPVRSRELGSKANSRFARRLEPPASLRRAAHRSPLAVAYPRDASATESCPTRRTPRALAARTRRQCAAALPLRALARSARRSGSVRRGCAGEGAYAAGGARCALSVALAQFDAVAGSAARLTERSCDLDGGRADVRRRVGRSALPGADRPPSVCAPASCSRNAPSTSAGPERVHLQSARRLLASVDGDPIRSARRRLICCARVSPTQRARGSRSAHLHGVSRFGAEEPRAVTASPTRSRACSASRRAALHDEVVHCAPLLGATHRQRPHRHARAPRAALPLALVALARHREASDAWAALAAAETDATAGASLTSAALVTANDCRRAMIALRAFAPSRPARRWRRGRARPLRDAMCQRRLLRVPPRSRR